MLVYIDEDAVEDSIGLLEVGRLLYGDQGIRSYALAVGERSGEAAGRFDCVFRASSGPVPNYDTATLARCIESLHLTYGFDAIVVPGTHWGRMIAPRAAMRLRAGLVADVTAVGVDGDDISMVRPAFSGRALATIVCRGDGPPTSLPCEPMWLSPTARAGAKSHLTWQPMPTPGLNSPVGHRTADRPSLGAAGRAPKMPPGRKPTRPSG